MSDRIFPPIVLPFFFALFLIMTGLAGCAEEGTIPSSYHPYNSFKEIQPALEIEERFELVPERLGDTLHRVDFPLARNFERGFDLVSIGEEHLLYFWDSNQLYRIDEDGRPIVIAEPGSDPNSIQEGVRLQQTGEEIYLIQRSRISQLECEPDCTLNVLKVYDHPGSINFFLPGSSDDFLTNTYHRSGKQTIHLVDDTFEILQSAGEYFDHPNPSLVANHNSSLLTTDRNGERFVHYFGSFANIALFDFDLQLRNVYQIREFNLAELNSGLENSASDFEINFLAPRSFLAVIHPLDESDFWVVIAHQRYLEQPTGFDPVEISQFFDYYTLNEINGLSYSGSSNHYIVPQGRNIYLMNDGLVYRLEDSLEDLSKMQRAEFKLPDGFQ